MRSPPFPGSPHPRSPTMTLPLRDSYFSTHPLPTPGTSHVHVITCPCHTDLLIATLQNLAKTTPGGHSFEHNLINVTTSEQPTLRDLITALLPFPPRTNKLLTDILSNIPHTIPQAVDQLTALPLDILTRLLSHLPSPFSTPAIPCLPPSPSQIYAALKHRIHLYLLQNNLFILVLINKSYEFYMNYCSIWVWFNIINLPLTFAIGVWRILKELVGGWIWGVVGSVLMVENKCGRENIGVVKIGDGRNGSFAGVDRGVWDVKKRAKNWEEEFLVVDLD